MTQVIVLHNKTLADSMPYVERAKISDQQLIWHSLSERQQQFVREYTWRAEFNWHSGKTELSIRKSQFSTEEWTQILFLFPLARSRRGPIR